MGMNYKLIIRTDPKKGYDDHCGELYNLYDDASYAAVKAELKDRLFKWYMHTSDVTRWQVSPRGGNLPWPPIESRMSGPSANPDDFMEYSLVTPILKGPHVYHV